MHESLVHEISGKHERQLDLSVLLLRNTLGRTSCIIRLKSGRIRYWFVSAKISNTSVYECRNMDQWTVPEFELGVSMKLLLVSPKEDRGVLTARVKLEFSCSDDELHPL